MHAPARPAVAALKATLVGGISSTESLSAVAPVARTLRGYGGRELTPVDVDATLFQGDATAAAAVTAGATASGGRTIGCHVALAKSAANGFTH